MEDQLLTLEEVAAHLRVSVPTVRRYIRQRALTAVKTDGPNGGLRVRPADYADYLRSHTKPATVTASEER